MATDPSKLSHHVHRIGYHFNSEVLEQAVADLNYTSYKGRFVKEEDLAKKRQESLTAQILLKHGIRMNEMSNEESHEQVRAAIKELFPKIPVDDLEGIVKHAWEEGTGRVGSAQALDLPRRVQLAVIARIRHKYTDYDRLLRAFEWKEARQMTEPVSLQKLIEWRGEQDVEDDGQLEEMVRETIVIDDEDDDSATLPDGSEADDEDSAAEQGDNSDASIEVINHLADDTDIGGESTYETRRPVFHRPQRRSRRLQRQQDAARQKIAAAHEQRRMYAARGAPQPYGHHLDQPDRMLTRNSDIPVVQVQHGPRGGDFRMDGYSYQQVKGAFAVACEDIIFDALQIPGASSASTTPGLSRPLQSFHPPPYAPQPLSNSDVTYTPGMRNRPPLQDRPVASIERDEGYRAASSSNPSRPPHFYGGTHRRPITPDDAHSSKRRRIDSSSRSASKGGGRCAPSNGHVVDLTTPEQPRRKPLGSSRGEVVNLMTPEPPYQPVHPSPLREVRNVPLDYGRVEPQPRYQQMQPVAAPPYHTSPMRLSPQGQMRSNAEYENDVDDLAYDPRQPMLQLPQQVNRLSIRPEQSQRPVINNLIGTWPASPSHPPPPPQNYYEVPQQPTFAQTVQPQHVYSFPPAPPPRIVYEQQQPSGPTPQPVHGAPAPVQVIPRYAVHQGYGRPPTVPPPQPPTDGAPAPVQVVPRYAPHSGYG